MHSFGWNSRSIPVAACSPFVVCRAPPLQNRSVPAALRKVSPRQSELQEKHLLVHLEVIWLLYGISGPDSGVTLRVLSAVPGRGHLQRLQF